MKRFIHYAMMAGVCMTLGACGAGIAEPTAEERTPISKRDLPKPVQLRSGETGKHIEAKSVPTRIAPPRSVPAFDSPTLSVPSPSVVAKSESKVEPMLVQTSPTKNADEVKGKKEEVKVRAAGREFSAGRSSKLKSLSAPSGLPSWFTDRDKDSDGQVGLYEWPSDDMKEFEKYDRNRDGFVTSAEVFFITQPTRTASASTEKKEEKKADEKPVSTSTTVVQTPPTADAKEKAGSSSGGSTITVLSSGSSSSNSNSDDRYSGIIKRSDKNGDGKLNKDEWPSYFGNFADSDANKDGFVDAKEMGEGFQKMQRGRGERGGGRRGFGFGF